MPNVKPRRLPVTPPPSSFCSVNTHDACCSSEAQRFLKVTLRQRLWRRLRKLRGRKNGITSLAANTNSRLPGPDVSKPLGDGGWRDSHCSGGETQWRLMPEPTGERARGGGALSQVSLKTPRCPWSQRSSAMPRRADKKWTDNHHFHRHLYISSQPASKPLLLD